MNGNAFVKFFLRSPLHIFMGRTMLISVTGRKTGTKYTTPVGYYRAGGNLWVMTSRERTWWRNVRDGAEVTLRLHGKEAAGFAEAVLDEEAVAQQVIEYVRQIPRSANSLGVRMEDGEPHPEDAARLAKKRLFVKIKLSSYP